MQSFCKTVRAVGSLKTVPKILHFQFTNAYSTGSVKGPLFQSLPSDISRSSVKWEPLFNGNPAVRMFKRGMVEPIFTTRCMSTVQSTEPSSLNGSGSSPDVAPRIKFKRLDKTAGHIMQILDKEAVEGVRAQREIPDIRPGYMIQLKVEVPENKRRISTMKGIVIARRNAGLNTTFRLRRQVTGVGVESVFPLYSPNIKEIKVLDKKKVRRAKLYYLRDRMNALNKK